MSIIGNRSQRARRREWLAQTRIRSRFERGLTNKLRREFDRVGSEAAAAYIRAGKAGLVAVRAAHAKRLTKILSANAMAVGKVFGQRVLDDAGIADLKAEGDVFTGKLRAYIAKNTAKKVKQISATTLRRIRRAIDDGVEAGLGQRAVAKTIRERTGGAIGRFRSNVIARTETHQASQFAITASVEAAGVEDKLDREWIAAEDDRTRETHSAANGQIRANGKPFDVGDAQLMYPGDPGGPPEETINCRCVVGYVPIAD